MCRMNPVAVFVFLGVLVQGGLCAEEVTIYRDTYGVPHIYGDSPVAAAYGLGYAQAEDRLDDIYRNVRTALGSMAEFFGPEHVEIDYIMRLMRNAKLCEEYWITAPAEIRELGDSFVRGINAYIAEHPERVPEHALELHGWHCAAVGRCMILQWPLGTIQDDFNQRDKTPPFASNAWAVEPKRSADNCAILLTDPHLTWESLAVFYEARVFGGSLSMNGFFVAGTPALAIGHNNDVGWACTTGGPDTSDVYALKIRKTALGFEYEYDGKWLQPRLSVFTIKVKGEDKPRAMPAMYTNHGPLIEEPDFEKGIAYAGKTPYMEDAGFFRQQYAMCMAKDADDFIEALRIDSSMEQNILFADRKGNIGYVRVGRTPIRPEGPWNWSAPVPGNTSATEWLGIHPLEDHVQIRNPEQGYMQNCNISPANMMLDSPMTPEKYIPQLYNVSWDKNNLRGRRAVELLSQDDSITKEEAIAIAMDVYDLLAKPWQDALRAAFESAGPEVKEDKDLAAAAQTILDWDGQFTQDSRAAAIIRHWRPRCEGPIDTKAIVEGTALSAEHQARLVELLRETLSEMQRLYGAEPVTWGDIHKVGRNGEFFPCDGADFGSRETGTETLRDVEAAETPEDSGRYVANSGSMSAMLMFFHEAGIDSYTCTPWGQSADPASPHHVDQARELYSKRRMKPTWFRKEDMLQHQESEKVLTVQ